MVSRHYYQEPPTSGSQHFYYPTAQMNTIKIAPTSRAKLGCLDLVEGCTYVLRKVLYPRLKLKGWSKLRFSDKRTLFDRHECKLK